MNGWDNCGDYVGYRAIIGFISFLTTSDSPSNHMILMQTCFGIETQQSGRRKALNARPWTLPLLSNSGMIN